MSGHPLFCSGRSYQQSQREFVAPQGPQEDEALLGFSDYVGCVHASAQVLQFVNNQDFEVGNPIYLLPINAQSGSLCCLCFPDTDYFSAAFLYWSSSHFHCNIPRICGPPPSLLFEIKPTTVICKFDECVGAVVRGAVVGVRGLEDEALGCLVLKMMVDEVWLSSLTCWD